MVIFDDFFISSAILQKANHAALQLTGVWFEIWFIIEIHIIQTTTDTDSGGFKTCSIK